jgi:membrane protein
MTLREFFGIFRLALSSWFANNASRHGAAIAYYTLFAMAPVLLVVIGVAGLVFGPDAVRGEIVDQIGGLIGLEAARSVEGILRRASEPREGIAATVLGFAGLILSTTGAFLELQAALNKIWRVKRKGEGGFDFQRLVRKRLRSLTIVVFIGFLLMVSLTVSTAVAATTAWFGDRVVGWAVLIGALNQIFSLAVSTVLFAVLFRVLPEVTLAWRDVLFGAVITAALFAIGQRLIGLYLGQSAVASPFGAAGTIAILLVWVFYTAQIVLLGAEFTYHHAQARRAPPASESR